MGVLEGLINRTRVEPRTNTIGISVDTWCNFGFDEFGQQIRDSCGGNPISLRPDECCRGFLVVAMDALGRIADDWVDVTIANECSPL